MVKRILVLTTEMHARHWYRLKSFLPYLRRKLKITVIDYSNMVNSREGYTSLFESIKTLIKNPSRYLWDNNGDIITTTSFLPTDYGKLLCTIPIGKLIDFRVEGKFFDAILASPLLAGVLALFLEGEIPIIYEDVDRFYEFYKNPVMRGVIKALEQYVIRKSDHVIAVSDILMKEDLLLRRDNRVSLIPNGVNLELISSILNRVGYRPRMEYRTIIYAGAIEEWSGIDKLIEAFSIAIKSEPRLKLIIIGDINTPYGAKIVKTIKKLNLRDRIHLIGRRPYEDVIRFLSRASIGAALFKPSNLTNKIMLPLKILEYSAVGLPFIVSDVGTIKRIVRDYGSGIVVNYNNVDEISERILLLTRDEKFWTKTSENAKIMAKAFDIRRLANMELKIIENVAREK